MDPELTGTGCGLICPSQPVIPGFRSLGGLQVVACMVPEVLHDMCAANMQHKACFDKVEVESRQGFETTDTLRKYTHWQALKQCRQGSYLIL